MSSVNDTPRLRTNCASTSELLAGMVGLMGMVGMVGVVGVVGVAAIFLWGRILMLELSHGERGTIVVMLAMLNIDWAWLSCWPC